MKNRIKITIAALSFISTAITGTQFITSSSSYIDNQVVNTPLIMNFKNEFTSDMIQNHKIESMTFSIECKTELDGYKAYLTQGQIYYYSDGEYTHRNFSDLVSVDNPEYADIQNCESLCTEITVGTETNPLNMDIDKDITLYWTWITPDKLSMYELSVTTTDGMSYMLYADDYYTVEQTDEMEAEPETYNTTGQPFNCSYYVSSIWNEDRGYSHRGMDLCSEGDYSIYAIQSGYVEYADWENPYDYEQGFGKYIKIVGDDGLWYYYGHCSELYLEVGDRVEAGECIAMEGTTGNSTGDHLHLEVRNDSGIDVDVSEILGIENQYGEVILKNSELEAEPETNDDLAAKCLSLNKYFEVGNLGANGINPDDSGAVSLGLCQWRGSNAKKMLRYLYDNNSEVYSNIANKYNPDYINMLWNTDSYWESHSITPNDNEYNFYIELLDDDTMIELQYEYGIKYENMIIEDAHSHNITDKNSILLFSRCYNYLPFGGTAKAMRNGMSYAEACTYAKNDTNILKADELISLIDNNNITTVTINTLKEER